MGARRLIIIPSYETRRRMFLSSACYSMRRMPWLCAPPRWHVNPELRAG